MWGASFCVFEGRYGSVSICDAECLRTYRGGGQQKVTVEHVTVQAGGQAIVGNVNRGVVGDAQQNGE